MFEINNKYLVILENISSQLQNLAQRRIDQNLPNIFECDPKTPLPRGKGVIDPTFMVNRLIKLYQEDSELVVKNGALKEKRNELLSQVENLEQRNSKLKRDLQKKTREVEKMSRDLNNWFSHNGKNTFILSLYPPLYLTHTNTSPSLQTPSLTHMQTLYPSIQKDTHIYTHPINRTATCIID